MVRRLRQRRRRRCAPTPRSSDSRAASACRRRIVYLRACNYYQMAERFRTPKDERALDAYRTGVDCFHRFAALTDAQDRDRRGAVRGRKPARLFRARAEREVGAHAVRGVLRRARRHQGDPVRARRARSRQARHLVPGDGRSRHRRGDPLPQLCPAPRLRGGRQRLHRLPGEARRRRCRSASASSPSASAATTRRAAPRMEPRFAACIAWGAIWDYYDTWKKRIDAAFKTSMSVPGHHIMWILGVDTLDAGAARSSSRSGSTAWCRRCAARSCWCTARTTSRSRSRTRRRSSTPAARRTRRFRVFTAEEGGAQHCQRDYLTLGVAEMWNWFEDKLVRA